MWKTCKGDKGLTNNIEQCIIENINLILPSLENVIPNNYNIWYFKIISKLNKSMMEFQPVPNDWKFHFQIMEDKLKAISIPDEVNAQ